MLKHVGHVKAEFVINLIVIQHFKMKQKISYLYHLLLLLHQQQLLC